VRRLIENALDLSERAFMAIAAIAVVVMMLSISIDTVGRYLFNRPITGNFEFISLYLMVILGFMAAARTYSLGGHIRLDLLMPRLPRRVGEALERLNALAAGAAFAVFTYSSSEEALDKLVNLHTTFGVIQFPVYLSYAWMPLGAALLTLRLLAVAAYGPARPGR